MARPCGGGARSCGGVGTSPVRSGPPPEALQQWSWEWPQEAGLALELVDERDLTDPAVAAALVVLADELHYAAPGLGAR